MITIQGKIMMGYNKSTFLIINLLIFLFLSNTIKAGVQYGIIIDNEKRQLIAPVGENYSWYIDGKLIENKQQKINARKSGTYIVEITDKEGAITRETISIIVKSDGIRKIYVIGDSTVQTYNDSDYPKMGWGQVLNLFFDDSKIQIVNKAIGGRSSRNFWEQGRWEEVASLLDSNDYVFIQFGHNDRDWSKPERYTDTADYKKYLRIYVNETREKGAIPVLVSPMIMNAWTGSTLRNVFTEGENNYRGAMLEVAEELDALFIDLNMKSYNLVKELGAEYAAMFLHMGLEPGEYPNYPDGSSDVGTHYQEMGAIKMASLIIEGITELAEDSTMVFLSDAFTPTTSLSIMLDIPEAGLITESGTYPIGSHITIKTRMNALNPFDHWEDTLGNTISSNNLYMFTMEDSIYFCKAVVEDCNREVGGEARIDDCLLCSGGSTVNPPCEVIFESEDACSFTGSKSYNYVGPVRRRVVNTISAENSPSIEYSIEAAVAGTYDFVFIYLSSFSGEQLNISVNGLEQLGAIDLVQAEEWSEIRFQLELDEGNNTILINSLATEAGILFDFLAAYSTNLSEGECVASSTSINKKTPQVNVYPNPFRETITIHDEGRFDYRVYNSAGIVVLNGIAEQSCKVGSELEQGIYILQIVNKGGIYTQVILKQCSYSSSL